MAEELNNGSSKTGFQEQKTVDNQRRLPAPDYNEETSAEFAAPTTGSLYRGDTKVRDTDDRETETSAGRGIGLSALALSIISLFVLPILFGAAGIILGFVARRRGATGTGNWAIGIGAISIFVGMFILPFF
jgi:hypothetical protein